MMRLSTGFKIVDHNLFGQRAKGGKGLLMAGKKVFPSLRDCELEVHHPAVAKDHDKEAEPSAAFAYPDYTKGTPIDLGALAGSK